MTDEQLIKKYLPAKWIDSSHLSNEVKVSTAKILQMLEGKTLQDARLINQCVMELLHSVELIQPLTF